MPSTMWLGRKSCPVCNGHWSCPFFRKGLALRSIIQLAIRSVLSPRWAAPLRGVSAIHGDQDAFRPACDAQHQPLDLQAFKHAFTSYVALSAWLHR